MPDTSKQSLAQHSLIGGFEILEKIGEGGMGAVYRARQASLNRIVALKVLTPRLAADAAYIESFRREAQAAARLQHPNIISVFQAGESDGLYHYAMEYVRGETVFRWLQREGQLPETTVIEITLCVANALKHAWEKERLIHRDVKPENIMVDTEGNVKLCDLGLAKTFGENTMLSLSGQVYGTPHYISPEQARGDRSVDQRSDIYSLGMSMYHMLTGIIPFHGDSPVVVMAKHLTDQLADPRDAAPKLSPNTCLVLEKMLAKNVGDRYQGWDEVGRDLELIHKNKPPQTPRISHGISTLRLSSPVSITTAPEPARPEPKAGSKKFVAVATAVFGLLIVAGALWMMSRPPSSVTPPPPEVVSPSTPPPRVTPPPPPPPTQVQPTALTKFLEIQAFATEKPQEHDKLAEMLRKFIVEFPNTSESGRAQKLLDAVLLRQTAEKKYREIQSFALSNPGETSRTIQMLQAFIKEYPDTPATLQAQKLLETLGTIPVVPGKPKLLTNSIGMELLPIPAGTFFMGSDNGEHDEKPVHPVDITKPFYMAKFEVTQKQYETVMGNNPSIFRGSEKLPVENVKWQDAVEFCRRLSEREKRKYRLPTEAEWEYACRAGAATRFSAGNTEQDLDRIGWYARNGANKTHDVGQKEPNAFGLYDMHGNVWEWCADWYDKNYYAVSPKADPPGPERGATRILRGGSCLSGALLTRASYRLAPAIGQRLNAVGFRVVLVE